MATGAFGVSQKADLTGALSESTMVDLLLPSYSTCLQDIYRIGSQMNRLVISYLTVRRAVGLVGIALPFVLVLGGLFYEVDIQRSISDYYHTVKRDIFVGSLCAVGVFLICYKGYDWWDAIVGRVAGIAAIGTALVPTTGEIDLHIVFAGIFFLALAFFSLFLFTRTKPGTTPTPDKLRRNRIYRISGGLIVLALILIAVVTQVPAIDAVVKDLKPVVWLESLAIVAFGVSWMTKGQAILTDVSDESPES